jgi:hypothetical protein
MVVIGSWILRIRARARCDCRSLGETVGVRWLSGLVALLAPHAPVLSLLVLYILMVWRGRGPGDGAGGGRVGPERGGLAYLLAQPSGQLPTGYRESGNCGWQQT